MKYIRPLCTLLFGVAVLLFFGLAYPHHLHYQEQYQLFLFDCTYVWEIVRLPGGIADLLGRFCTQFFLFAWVGAAIIGAASDASPGQLRVALWTQLRAVVSSLALPARRECPLGCSLGCPAHTARLLRTSPVARRMAATHPHFCRLFHTLLDSLRW